MKRTQGYYITVIENTNTLTQEKSDYEVVVFVEEIERYANNLSKIKLLKMELKSGYSIDKYNNNIKPYIKDRFIELKSTDHITWLEKGTDLKAERKDKLKKINGSNFFKRIFGL